METAQRLDNSRSWGDISIVLTDNAGIVPINQEHLESSEVTDVISFCYEPMPGDNELYSGEIIINTQRAVETGRNRKNWTASRELALYIAHGCDHLYGEDDYDLAGQNRMRRRELRWIKRAGFKGLDKGLIS